MPFKSKAQSRLMHGSARQHQGLRRPEEGRQGVRPLARVTKPSAEPQDE
jgi:hypothetical protein